MRKRIQMCYVGAEVSYAGNSKRHHYLVVDVRDMETGELLCNQYVFLNSKIFEKRKVSVGNTIRMTVTVENNSGYFRFIYPKNIEILTN